MFRVGLLVLVVVTAAWRWWTISHWSWFADDWIYLYETQQQGFLAYVFQGYNSHLMPGQFLVTWLITAWQPLDFGLAAIVLTVFAVASLIAWAAALREIFGEKVQLLFPLVLLALSPLLLMPTVWWASGIQVLPLQLFMGLSVLFVARYSLRGHRRSDMAALLVSYGLGLFFWEKALLIAIPVLLVSWVLSSGGPRQRLVTALRVLAPPTVLGASYAVLYLSTRRAGAVQVPRTEFAPQSAADWATYMSSSARDVGLPALIGGPFERMSNPWDHYTPGPQGMGLVLAAVFVVGGLAAVVVRRHGGPAVACLVLYACCTWGLVVTSARFILDGSSGTGRYTTDLLSVAALAIALVTTPTVLEPGRTALRRPLPSALVSWGRNALGMGAVAITVVIVVVNVSSWWLARESSPEPWVSTVVSDTTRAGDATLVNAFSPANVMSPIIFREYATLKSMLRPLNLPVTFGAPSGQLLMPDSDGHLMEAEVVKRAAKNRPTDDPTCGFLVRPGGITRIPITVDLYAFAWAVRVDYFAERPTRLTLSTDSVDTDLNLEKGLRLVQFTVTDSISSITVSAPADASPVCVTQVFVGRFAASDRSPFQ